MIISFKTKKLEKSLTTDKGLARTYGELSKKIKQRLNQLQSAECLEDISKLPVLRLHQYIGKDNGTWSIDIHKNWRILFTINQDPIPTKEDGGVDLSRVTIISVESVEDPH
ncbi:MAG: type II toxin-antitoxin system RelE/ParE family toxin [Candidatus Kapaibacterium sp.]|nr:type II toxin-antitoxin system RelE/ParE family toxin [Ignavibacteria bacterium]